MTRQLMTATTLVAALAFACAASAEVLYSDTFTRVTGSGDANGDPNGPADNFSDWGTNDNGLGGTVSQAWAAGPSRAGGGRNAVTNGTQGVAFGTTSLYEFDVAAVAPLGFEIAFDFSRFVIPPDPGPGAGGYIAFGLGVDIGSALNDFTAIGASDFSVLFQQANNGNAANASVFEDNVSVTNFDYFDPDSPHTLVMTVVPAVAGAYGVADSIDVELLIDGTLSQSFTTLGGDDFGTFAVSSNNFDARYIDNLVVSVIPEPTSLVLASLVLGGTLVGRRGA